MNALRYLAGRTISKRSGKLWCHSQVQNTLGETYSGWPNLSRNAEIVLMKLNRNRHVFAQICMVLSDFRDKMHRTTYSTKIMLRTSRNIRSKNIPDYFLGEDKIRGFTQCMSSENMVLSNIGASKQRLWPSREWWLLLVLLVACAAFLRYTGYNFSLPYMDHVDEPAYNIAGRMILDNGSAKPLG